VAGSSHITYSIVSLYVLHHAEICVALAEYANIVPDVHQIASQEVGRIAGEHYKVCVFEQLCMILA
jgi:hypothetical protein